MLLRCERREYDIAVEDRMSVKQAEDKVKQLGALRDTFDATLKVGTAASNAQSHALDAEVQVCVRLTAAGQRFQLTGVAWLRICRFLDSESRRACWMWWCLASSLSASAEGTSTLRVWPLL